MFKFMGLVSWIYEIFPKELSILLHVISSSRSRNVRMFVGIFAMIRTEKSSINLLKGEDGIINQWTY